MTSDGFTAASTTITASQATSGESFSFSASYLQGDAVPSSAATVGDIPNFGSVTSYTAGTAGNLWQVVSVLTVLLASRRVELVVLPSANL